MNAYELADELAECIIDGSTDLVCVAQAANMLRQQADRIAELEKQTKPTPDGLIDPKSYYIGYADAKQTKPLSDEEIFAIAIPTEIDGTDEEVLTFARAIEERHGIK